MAIETEFTELRPVAAGVTSRRSAAVAVRPPRTQSVYLVATYAILILAGVVALFPFGYVISTSFKHTLQLFHYPPQWFPHPVTTINYHHLIADSPFPRWTVNSFVVAS